MQDELLYTVADWRGTCLILLAKIVFQQAKFSRFFLGFLSCIHKTIAMIFHVVYMKCNLCLVYQAHEKLEEGRKQVETQDTAELAMEVRPILR